MSDTRELAEAKCLSCGAPIATYQPQVEVLNSEKYSIVIIPHKEGLECLACGAYFIWVLAQIANIVMVPAPAERPKDKPLLTVVPAFGRIT